MERPLKRDQANAGARNRILGPLGCTVYLFLPRTNDDKSRASALVPMSRRNAVFLAHIHFDVR